MKIARTRFAAAARATAVAASLAAALLPSTPAHADAASDRWPDKPVRWIVPFPPGGAMDRIARILGEQAGKRLNGRFVIENKPGAGGNIGSDLVAKAPADGYTLLITSIGMVTNQPLYGKLSYDPQKDFAPVSMLAVVPNVLVVNQTLPAVKSVADLVAAARREPGKLNYASAGNGTSIHLAGEMFGSLAKVELTHIPYKGSGPAVGDLLGGQVNLMFDSITSAKPHIESGKLRPLGLTTATRSPALPDVPTLAEAGVPGYDLSPWFTVFVPAGTPPSIIDKIHRVFSETMQRPDVRAQFDAIGAQIIDAGPAETAQRLTREGAMWTRLIQERGIRLQ